jgi:hypothetical protein
VFHQAPSIHPSVSIHLIKIQHSTVQCSIIYLSIYLSIYINDESASRCHQNGLSGVLGLAHFLYHIIIDGQVVLPQWLFPPLLRDLLAWYAALLNDPLMSNSSNNNSTKSSSNSSSSSNSDSNTGTGGLLWFQALVTCELCFQLPFFIVAVCMLNNNKYIHNICYYPNWFRHACIAYGAHTATAMAPILATLILNTEAATVPERVIITALYLPYLIFPLWILLLAVQDNGCGDDNGGDNGDNDNGGDKKSKKA